MSTRIKESIKTALAMTIAYGIALGLDWDNAKWAAFAVAFVSLATLGQSLNKAAMRMLGTFLAIFIALIIIALTAQARWNFIILLATYIAFCTYMMSGTKHNYFWNVSGFVCAIICFHAGPNSESAFNLAVLRAQETGLGILVYSIIAFLLWPSSSRNQFFSTVQKYASTQKQLIKMYFELLDDSDKSSSINTIRLQEIQIRNQFNVLLDAAETESNEISQMKDAWRIYQKKSIKLIEIAEKIRCNYIPLQELPIYKLLPNLKEFTDEITTRLAKIENLLTNEINEYQSVKFNLTVNKVASDKLLNFQKAALTLTISHYQELEVVTRDLINIISDIKKSNRANVQNEKQTHQKAFPVLDPDRFDYAIRIFIIMFIAYLSVIYIDDIPGKYTIVTISTVFGMFISTMPQINVWRLLKPALLSISFAGTLYIFVMPHLSSYLALGPLIFGITFLICYLFASPKQALGRVLGLAMFIIITGIDNQQSYSFLTVANTVLMFPIAFLIIAITAYLPKSWMTEHVFHRLLKRYFSSSAYLVSSICNSTHSKNSFYELYKHTFHLGEISKIPIKLNSWIKFIPKQVISGVTTEQIQTLVNNTETLTLRIKELQKIHNSTYSMDLFQEIQLDLQEWCERIINRLNNLSNNPGRENSKELQIKLDKILEKFEADIESNLAGLELSNDKMQKGKDFYHLLGAFRNLSESLITYVRSYEAINWNRWNEERFA